MAVKMRRWSPWPPAAAAVTRKFQVAVKPILEIEELPEGDMTEKFVAIKIKWKGEPRFFPFQRNSNQKQQFSSEKIVKRGHRIIRWDEDEWFENTCRFTVDPSHDQKFGAWEVAFNVLYGEKMNSKASPVVIGRGSIDIAEIAGKMEKSAMEKKLPLNFKIGGVTGEATLTVLLNIVEIREHQESPSITRPDYKESSKGRRRALSEEELNLDTFQGGNDSTEANLLTKSVSYAAKGTQFDSDNKKEGWFSWKTRGFSFKRAKTKQDKSEPKTEPCAVDISIDGDPQDEASVIGAWEEKSIISRDGQTKLQASVFFASFDQRSDKAAGESACTALVAVISHWLHSNSDSMPNKSEFDNLIIQGSSEWRKLCENVVYVNDFPNKHFDLETVLRAGIRPISILHDSSFVGFFGAEKFESLKDAMSFDNIWNGISKHSGASDEKIYVVSWNDHFFVMKADANAYYIIDTLGERLYEGCNQAFVLRFDETAVMQKQADKGKVETEESKSSEDDEKEEDGEIICRGKECCGEFIKRFLAAIPLSELEEEEKKKAVSYYSLHQRLQIEFNYSCLSSPLSSLTSSPFSSTSTTSTSSPFF